MSTHHLSSLKWNEEGELSPQDTWNLVTKLTKAEDESKASNLLHLSSKHSHARAKKTILKFNRRYTKKRLNIDEIVT